MGYVADGEFERDTRYLSSRITADGRDGWPVEAGRYALDLYLEALRPEIDAVMAEVYEDVNDGVYRCGFAGDQSSYERAYERLFERLDDL